MLNLVIWIAVILVGIILFTIFRVFTLLQLAKGDVHPGESSNNKVSAALFIVFLVTGVAGFFWYSIKEYDNYTLPVASEHGVITDNLFWITMAVTVFVFITTHVVMFYFSYKYQYNKDNVASFYPHNNKLEIIWTIIPAIVLTLLIGSGLKAWWDITDEAPEGSEVIEIVGYQYAWSSRYPGKDKKLGSFNYKFIDAENQLGMDFTDKNAFDDFIPREIHVPKGKPVQFKIRARDVIHSVYVPHFRLQMNAVPGMPTQFWFVPNKSTEDMRIELGNPDFNYELVCNKICGKGHFAMRYIIVVDEPAEYEKWYASQDAWLAKNPDYIVNIPQNLKELALISAGINNN
jgi:cytochrome c oxidase subunit 2